MDYRRTKIKTVGIVDGLELNRSTERAPLIEKNELSNYNVGTI